MSDVTSWWKVRTTLEYAVPMGSHIDEIGKAKAMMEQEMQRQGVTGDVFLDTDDDHVLLTAVVEERQYPDRPKFQVTRGVFPDRIGEVMTRGRGAALDGIADQVSRDPNPTGMVDISDEH